jgi:hypothetical protein
MQFAPIKTKLKAPGTKRLKLKYDGPVSNFAFKTNLRLYTKRVLDDSHACKPFAEQRTAAAYTRPLFQLNVTNFRGIRRVHDFPPVC